MPYPRIGQQPEITPHARTHANAARASHAVGGTGRSPAHTCRNAETGNHTTTLRSVNTRAACHPKNSPTHAGARSRPGPGFAPGNGQNASPSSIPKPSPAVPSTSPAIGPVKPCQACGGCGAEGVNDCVQEDPAFEGMVRRFADADGYLIGSPVYFGSATPQTMCLLDRVGYVARCGDNFLRRKAGAAIVVARRAGQNFTMAQLDYFFLINEMIVPGSTYWNIAFGREKGEVKGDEEGMQTVETLAGNMAWLMKKLGG